MIDKNRFADLRGAVVRGVELELQSALYRHALANGAPSAPRRLAGGIAFHDDVDEAVEAALIQLGRRKFVFERKAVSRPGGWSRAEIIEIGFAAVGSPGRGARVYGEKTLARWDWRC